MIVIVVQNPKKRKGGTKDMFTQMFT